MLRGGAASLQVSDDRDAADVTQETFARMFPTLPAFRGTHLQLERNLLLRAQLHRDRGKPRLAGFALRPGIGLAG